MNRTGVHCKIWVSPLCLLSADWCNIYVLFKNDLKPDADSLVGSVPTYGRPDSESHQRIIYQMHNNQIKHAEVIIGNGMYLITG